MGFTTRVVTPRKSAILGGAALALGMLGSSGAWAQCTDNFNFRATNVPSPGQFAPVSVLAPLGTGSSLSAFISTINSVNTAFLTNTTAFVSAPGKPQPDQQGGGVWGRVIGGSVDTKTTSTGSIDVSALGQPPDTGKQTCHTTVRQDYVGLSIRPRHLDPERRRHGSQLALGRDRRLLRGPHQGQDTRRDLHEPELCRALLHSRRAPSAPKRKSPTSASIPPSPRATSSWMASCAFDYYTNSLSDSANGLFGQRLDARGVSLTGNVGYNIPLHSGWFVEPSAGLVWSRVEIDPLNVPGVLQTAFAVRALCARRGDDRGHR